jgi:hypothetical protein
MNKSPRSWLSAASKGNVLASAKFPKGPALLPHHRLADAITPDQAFAVVNAARLLRSDVSAMGTAEKYP